MTPPEGDIPTYYGRPQLHPAPFEPWAVGGYVFLAGLSGSAALLSRLVLARDAGAAPTARHGRLLALLAPTLGSVLLVWDLHTPQRALNMLRIARITSPMSIGTWLLTGFGACSIASAAAELAAPRLPWLHRLARLAHTPAAALGAGLCTYTAALLSATSTPLWAAAPRALAARFGSSSVATGAAALSLLEPRGSRRRRRLDAVMLAALGTELVAARAAHSAWQATGVSDALRSGWGRTLRLGGTDLGAVLPLGLAAAAALAGRRTPPAAALAALAGSLLLRVATLGAGGVSAERPEISLKFTEKDRS